MKINEAVWSCMKAIWAYIVLAEIRKEEKQKKLETREARREKLGPTYDLTRFSLAQVVFCYIVDFLFSLLSIVYLFL
jgi:hypothetical protein